VTLREGKKPQTKQITKTAARRPERRLMATRGIGHILVGVCGKCYI
jgi:hypothetical protein